MLVLKPVLCQRHIEYECGCKGFYQVLGTFQEEKRWNILTCALHYKDRVEIEKRLHMDWKLIYEKKL